MAKAFIPHNKVMKSEKYGSLSFCEIQFGENVDDDNIQRDFFGLKI